MNIENLSGTSIAGLIKSGQISATEVMQQTLSRADDIQARCHPFITITHERAIGEAEQADKLLRKSQPDALPELFGVPFSVKDLLDTRGVTTTYGSRALAGNIPQSDVAAIARLRAAGAILIGKTTTPEFATKVTTDSELFGVTRNIWDNSLSAGGSSGGAGVAVAAGAGALAVSTDGGGSARIPAAANGILGLKVTIGAIPHESWPFHFGNNSSISMNCRHPEDLVAMFNAMAGAHQLDPWSRRSHPSLNAPHGARQKLSGRKALFIPAIGGNTSDQEYLSMVVGVVERFNELHVGVDFANNDPTGFDPGIATQMIVCNLAARVRQLPREQQEQLGPVLKSLLEDENYRPDGVRIQSDAMLRSRCYDTLEQLLGRYDFIITPTLTAAPPPADPAADQSVIVNGERCTIDKWWSHLSLANMTGHPAISIPCGKDSKGLPVGLHAVARWDQEQDLVDLAAAVTQIAGDCKL